MGPRTAARHPWWGRARERAGLLALDAAVTAAASAAVVLLVVLGPAAAASRAAAVTDPVAARAAVTVATALDGLAVAVVVVLTAVALVVVARRVGEHRGAEDLLYTARGATRAQLGRWGAAEGALVGVVGSAAGVAVGTVLAVVLVGRVRGAAADPARSAQPDVVVLTAVAVVAVAVLGNALVSAVLAARARDRRSGVAGQVVTAAVLVAAAAFSTWRLLAGGPPITVDGTAVAVDPVAVVAPVVWVLAGAAVVVLVGAVAARAVARAVRTTRGLLPAVTARRTARSWSATAPVVLTAAVVAGTGVFVAGFAATVAAVDGATVRAVVGTDVRVRVDGDAQVGGRSVLPDLRVPGVRSTAVTPVWTDTADLGAGDAQVVAVPGARAAAVLPGAAGAALERARSTTPSGVPVTGDSVSVRVRTAPATFAGTTRPDAVGSVRFDAWVVDGEGTPALVPLSAPSGDDAVPVGSSGELSGRLPEGGSAWRLLAVEPTLSFSSRPADTEIVTGTDTEPAPRLEVEVTAAVGGGDGGSGRVTVQDLAPPNRVVLGPAPDQERLPVVLTRTLADELDVRTGADLDVTPAATSSTLRTTVVAVVPSVPGAASRSALALDLGAVVANSIDGGAVDAGSPVPRADERWIDTSDPAAVARDLRGQLPGDSTVTTPSAVRAAPVVGTAVLGLAAVALLGGLLLVLVTSMSVAGPDRSRPALRAAGVPASASALARATALAVTTGLGVVGGTLAGLVAVALTVTPFALAAVPTADGLVDTAPVVASATTWTTPTLLVLAVLAVAASVLVRGRRAEGRP
ncbi:MULTISPECIES: FtsX-like permease family protein [unclassified Curtobacterium]|uniref:FtsX-like permease family protein n=1 Tax=unclassified Curtobacterium TaxID=257496 RepID=UPI0008DCEE2D|nr:MULTISPECIES: FtsX-like permease family protein [unclassified Curtobacterium]OIH97424.1 hypothetical protein BIU92_15625 [Curtobacterium sp. MCBA15_003]OII29424.1 hypothetical protein BIU94_11990 [Curtobacterium sp. MMLR14_006]